MIALGVLDPQDIVEEEFVAVAGGQAGDDRGHAGVSMVATCPPVGGCIARKGPNNAATVLRAVGSPAGYAAHLVYFRRPLAQGTDSRHSMRMATPITISIPHQLGRAEARRRIEAGFAKIIKLLPGSSGAPSVRWDGDRLIFSVAAMGQTVSGVIHVLDAAVTMEIEMPGVLGVIARGLKERLQKMGQLLLKNR